MRQWRLLIDDDVRDAERDKYERDERRDRVTSPAVLYPPRDRSGAVSSFISLEHQLSTKAQKPFVYRHLVRNPTKYVK